MILGKGKKVNEIEKKVKVVIFLHFLTAASITRPVKFSSVHSEGLNYYYISHKDLSLFKKKKIPKQTWTENGFVMSRLMTTGVCSALSVDSKSSCSC